MTAAEETWVWEGFRAIPLEGEPLYVQLRRHVRESAVASAPGATLEVGTGDGAMWAGEGRSLLESLAQLGEVWLTDADEQLAQRLKAGELCEIPGVHAAKADVRALPFPGGKFARVFVFHVLHWCGTPAAVVEALAELRAVLGPAGRAFIVVVDERIHMTELYRLLAEAKARLLATGFSVSIDIPSASPRVLPFCAGNAEPFLRERFSTIDRAELRYAHVLRRSPVPNFPSAGAFMKAYVATLPFVRAAIETHAVPPQFCEVAGALVDEAIAAEGAFRMSRCDVLYACGGSERPR